MTHDAHSTDLAPDGTNPSGVFLMLVVRRIVDQVRSHLFFIPASFMLISAALAWLTNTLDGAIDTDDLWFLLPTSLQGARTVLGTIAGATITVAALVFSITAVTVQLSASQYSPRVLDGFLRDRFQQTVVGIVVGTFTFSLISLATIGAGTTDIEEGVAAPWSTTTATVLGIVTVLAIVGFIDHVTGRIRVDDMIRRLARETEGSMRGLFGRQPENEDLSPWDVDLSEPSGTIAAGTTGWIQKIDVRAMLRALPDGSAMRIEYPVGAYVNEVDVIAVVWPTDDEWDERRVQAAVQVGDTRTIERDPGFGLRQLTDIAVRALSPGINDPATAADVIRHLAGPFRIALVAPPRRRVYRSEDGSRVFIPEASDRADYIRTPFVEIRHLAVDQPLVLQAMVELFGGLRRHLMAEGLEDRCALVDEQIERLRGVIARSRLDDADLVFVEEAFARFGLDAGMPA